MYEVICHVTLTHNSKFEANSVNFYGDLRLNQWTMNTDQGHWHLHGCFASVAFNPIALRKAKILYNFKLYTILAFLSAQGLNGYTILAFLSQ